MLMVYKITNLINNKCYIGSTIRGLKRFEEHKKDGFNPAFKHYNYPLYQAFRKYGLENFKFEILRDDFNDIDEMQQYEHDMIIFYNALNHGYNQTLETNCALRDPQAREKYLKEICQPCALVNNSQEIIKIFPSYQEASRQMNFNNMASKIRDVCIGKISSINGYYFRLLDENNQVIKIDIKTHKNKKSIIAIDPTLKHQDLYFDSILAASKELGINRQSIQKCIKGEERYWLVGGYIFRQLTDDGEIIENNILIDDAQQKYNKTNPIINNEQHNITEWLKIYNLSKTSYYKRIKKGMNEIQALTMPKKGG